jgi:predicted ATPase
MANLLKRMAVRNYRALAKVDVDLGPLNVFFGPNGAGKSTLLDTIWFARDCAKRGASAASAQRSHGIGMLWDGAAHDALIEIGLETEAARYALEFGLSSGRIESHVGERLQSLSDNLALIVRRPGADTADFYDDRTRETLAFPLREPDKLALARYVDFQPKCVEAGEMDRLLQFVHKHECRSFDLHGLRSRGSESSHETWLWDRGQNAWSVLRNLLGRRGVDDRYDTIDRFMRKAFPSFDGLIIEQTGPLSVATSFLEKGRRKPISASGVSDGHLQLLLLLTAIFDEGRDRDSLFLLDEPEVSLHPHALAVLADALKEATSNWNKQILVATHSPVLISEVSPICIFAATTDDGGTRLTRIDKMPGIQDLLEEYAAGSLFMAETLAPQGGEPIGGVKSAND